MSDELKIGDVFEFAEPGWIIRRDIFRLAMQRAEKAHRMKLGPITYSKEKDEQIGNILVGRAAVIEVYGKADADA